MSQIIRRPILADHPQWKQLWNDYLIFYKASDFSANLTDLLWQRIFDVQHPIECFVAEDHTSGELTGLVHYLPHADTWQEAPVCYLEDLFVNLKARGEGTGEALIQAVVDEAETKKWAEVYWHTQKNNTIARGLYDKLTGGTDGFITYRI